MARHADMVIVGAGIVGVATALELQARRSAARIVIIDKESGPATHQSGHNSGVIHAGVYYTPGSLKAQFCRAGVDATEAFCAEHGVPHLRCGKLIVATNDVEAKRLEKLGQRARQNGIKLEDVDETSLRKTEPNINGVAALYSPTTGITDYRQITQAMVSLFQSRGGDVLFGESVLSARETSSGVSITTSEGSFAAEQVVTCAGLHSDRVIQAFGQEPGYQVVPFRGEFFQILNQPKQLVKHLIYPVPDPARPFLGVHLTRKLNGGFTVGPNAVLAFKREGYSLKEVSLRDIAGTLGYRGFWRMLAQNAQSAASELTASMSKRAYLKRVQTYCSGIRLQDLAPYPAGVRAQAVSPDGKIVDDFLFVNSTRCLHVGNAPSPAATSAIPIAQHIADQMKW